MTQAIWLTGAIAALALASVTLYLIVLNWNQQLGGTVLSVLLGGTVTLFIAVFSQLKEASVSRQFVVDLPFDVATGLPASGVDITPTGDEAIRRMAWLSRIHAIALQPHMPALQPGQSASIDLSSIARSVTSDQMFDACSQLLQYKLLEDLRDYQRVKGSSAPVVDGLEIPSAQAPDLAGPVEDLPQAVLQPVLKMNRFHVPHALLWQHRTLRIPPQSSLMLRHVPSSEATGVVKDLIVVTRPNYFRAVITVEPLGAGASGQASLHTVRLAVTMKATFFKIAAGSAPSAGAKAWFEWLFGMLRDANAP